MDGSAASFSRTTRSVAKPESFSAPKQSSPPEPAASPHELREGFFSGCDGTRLYYQVMGTGPAIIACNGIGVSTFFWKYLQQSFCDRFSIVLWDYRGHGRSAYPYEPHRVSMETLAEDLHLLVQHLKLAPAIMIGHSMGVQVILEHYRQYPEEVRALVPVLGAYGRPLDTFMGYHRSRPIFNWIYDLVFHFPQHALKVFKSGTSPRFALKTAPLFGLVDRLYCPVEDLQQYLEHLSAMDLPLLMRMAMAMADHSARDVLESVHVPTLIIAGERDAFTPIKLSYEMRDKIPGAELLVLHEGSHAALIEQPEVMTNRLEQFIVARGLQAPAR